MPKRRYLSLTQAQRAELERVRDHDRRPYLRERAAALLKIADGQAAHAVAATGLLKPRAPDTLYAWMDSFQEHGTLIPRPPCRGRFSPQGQRPSGSARTDPSGS